MNTLSPDHRFVRIADRLQDLLMVSILLAAPLVFYTHGHDVFEFNKITAVRILAVLAAALMMFRLVFVRPRVLVRSPLDWPLAFFLLVSLVCTFNTHNLNLSLNGVYEDFEGITTVVMYVFLCWWTLQHVRSVRQVHLFAGAVILAGACAGFYGILQNFQIDFVPWNPATYSAIRMFSTMGNPNFLAAYLVMSLPITVMAFLDLPERIHTDRFFCGVLILLGTLASFGLIALFNIDYLNFDPAPYDSRTVGEMLLTPKFLAAHLFVFFPLASAVLLYFGRVKLVLLISMAFQVISIAYTKSRGGTIALGAAFVLLAGYFAWELARSKRSEVLRRNRWWLAGFGALILLAQFSGSIRETTLYTFRRIWDLTNFTHFTLTPRLYIWRAALQMLDDHFLFGTGLDTFQIVFPKYRTAIYWALEWNGTPEKAHNVILQTAATMGLAGLAACFWIIAAFIAATVRALKNLPETSQRMLVAGVFAAAAAFFVQDVFSFTVVGYGSLCWMIMGFVPAMEAMWTAPAPEISPTPEEDKKVPGLALALYLLACLGLFMFASQSFRIWVADSYYKQGQVGMGVGNPGYAIVMYEKSCGRMYGRDGAGQVQRLLTSQDMERILRPVTGTASLPFEAGLNPDQELYWVKLGIAYEAAAAAQKDLDLKERTFLTALAIHHLTLEMNPSNGYNFNNKGRVLKSMGEALGRRDYLENAIRHYDLAIAKDPNNVYFTIDQVNTYIDMGDLETALAKVKALIARYENLGFAYTPFALPYSYAGFILMRLGRGPEAASYFASSLDKDWKGDSNSKALAATNLAVLLSGGGKKKEALAALDAALEANPEFCEAYQNKANLLIQMGKKKEAVEAVRSMYKVEGCKDQAEKFLKQMGAEP